MLSPQPGCLIVAARLELAAGLQAARAVPRFDLAASTHDMPWHSCPGAVPHDARSHSPVSCPGAVPVLCGRQQPAALLETGHPVRTGGAACASALWI